MSSSNSRTGDIKDIPSFLKGLEQGEHGCVFYLDPEDKRRILLDFLRSGLAQGQFSLYLTANETTESIQFSMMESTGEDPVVNVEDFMVIRGDQLYGSLEKPDLKRWLSSFEQFFEESAKRHKNAVRIAADLSSHFLGRGLMDEWFKLELAVGRRFANRATLLCAYDAHLVTNRDVANVLDFYKEFLGRSESRYMDAHSFAIFPIERDKGLILIPE